MKYLQQFEEKPENLFGKLFWNMFFCVSIFTIPISLMVLIGWIPFSFNDEPYYGISGFLMSLILIPFVPLCFAISIWIYYSIGNYFLRLFNKIF